MTVNNDRPSAAVLIGPAQLFTCSATVFHNRQQQRVIIATNVAHADSAMPNDAPKASSVVSEPASERTTLHRYAHRAAYDRPTIDAILDEGIVCHVGLQTDRGFPVVIPLAYGRDGRHRVPARLGGQPAVPRRPDAEVEICMTVTLVDGLVVARSTYNTDINYRSVVIIGEATEVKDLDEKRHGLGAAGRAHHPRPQPRRPAADREGAAQHHAAAAALTESSAKVRTGWPLDEDEDYDLDIWAGVMPFIHRSIRGRPCAATRLCRARHVADCPARTWRAATRTAPGSMNRVERRASGAEPHVRRSRLLIRDPSLEPQLGSMLVPMIEALDERGPDSSGIAVYADRPRRLDRDAHAADLAGQRRARRLDGARLAPCCDGSASGVGLHRFGAGLVVERARGRR